MKFCSRYHPSRASKQLKRQAKRCRIPAETWKSCSNHWESFIRGVARIQLYFGRQAKLQEVRGHLTGYFRNLDIAQREFREGRFFPHPPPFSASKIFCKFFFHYGVVLLLYPFFARETMGGKGMGIAQKIIIMIIKQKSNNNNNNTGQMRWVNSCIY